jgi:GLPGLI family protein
MNNYNIKNKKVVLIVLLALFININSKAQQLIRSGKITFERNENLHKLITDNSSWSQAMKSKMPKYRTDIFELTFNNKNSNYKIIQEDESQFANWYYRVAAQNSVYTLLESNKMIADKIVYERSYRIEDSIPNLKWKMLGEYRNIAGFNCRKAATIIMDSIYVIAFYTDEISVSAGPESFQGLPGMILGIVIPRLNITCFASKVEKMVFSDIDFKIPNAPKNKKTKIIDFKKEILKDTKDWGEDGPKIYWKSML